MSYLGAIRFVLTTDGSSVSDVSIEPAYELKICSAASAWKRP